MQYITIRIAKRIGTITYIKETVYKDIHIHVLIKTVEGQDVGSIATAIGLSNPIHRVCQTKGNTPTQHVDYSFMKIQNINMQQKMFK